MLSRYFGNIPHDEHLISPIAIEPIQKLKVEYLGSRNPRLHTDEVLIALSMCAATNKHAQIALEQLENCAAARFTPPSCCRRLISRPSNVSASN